MVGDEEQRESFGDRYLRVVAPFERVWDKLVFPIFVVLFAAYLDRHGWNWVSVVAAAYLAIMGAVMFAGAWGRFRSGPRPEPAAPTPEVTELVRVLMHEGKTVEAVRLLREQTGLGLRDARRETERIAARDPVYRAR